MPFPKRLTNREAREKARELAREFGIETSEPDLCEWDPARQAPARTKDPFHGIASVRMVYVRDGEPIHVCADCAGSAETSKLLRYAVQVEAA